MKTTVRDFMGCEFGIEIEKGKSIRLFGLYKNYAVPKSYDITFKIGDQAEYHSYNLKYTGSIVSITEKSITIQPEHGDRKSRLSITEFAWRNWNFDAEKVSEHNANELMYI